MTTSGMRPGWVVSALAAAVLLAACSREPTEAEALAAAKKSLEENKPRAAVIHLRNALQNNPNLPQGRLLMGEALFLNGEVRAAHDEFRRARDAGLADAISVPPLARTMLLLEQNKKVIDEFGAMRFDDKAADADLALSLAHAHTAISNAAQSEQFLQRSLQAAPGYQPALIYKTRLILRKSGPAAALTELQSHPELLRTNAEAAGLEGSLRLNAKQDVEGAIEAFQRALRLEPKDLHAHGALVAVYLYKNDKVAARDQVEALKKAQPNTPVAQLYDAQMSLLEGDPKKARTLALQVLQSMPNSVRAMYIAGSAELQSRNNFHAITLLRKALSLQPNLPDASKLLARAYVQSGQPQLALKALAAPLERAPGDPELLTVAAEAHLQIGDAGVAEALYKKAVAAQPDDAQTKTALALAVMAKGDEGEGLRQLSSLARQDDSPIADMVLISSYLARNKLDAALEQVANLDRKEPTKPGAPFSRGRILLLKGDNAGARAAFEESLKRDASFLPALNNLALLDLRDGKVDVARSRFEALLKSDSGNVAALMSLADVLVIQNAPQAEVTALLERAVTSDPSDPAPRVMLVEYLIRQGSHSAAVAAGQKGVVAISSSPELFNALGRAQAAVGDGAQAQASFSKQAQLQPAATSPYLSAAEAYRRAGDRANAVRSLRQALTNDARLLPAQEMLFALELRAGRYPQALEIAREVQRQRPLLAQGYQLEGAVHEAQRKWDAAVSTYKRGIDRFRADKRDASMLAARTHQALLAAKRLPEAAKFGEEWMQANPDDVAFRFYLGDLELTRREWAAAERHYRAVLAKDPRHALATNNVAAVLVRMNRPEAVDMAREAVKLAPSSADAQDTLAMSLAAAKQWDPAIEAQRKAISLAPTSSMLKIKLARLLIDAGRKSDAERELKELQALGGKFDRQIEVEALLKKL